MGKSNNYPMFCVPCRKDRTTSNKQRFDRVRTDVPSKNALHILNAIPDYIVQPVKVIDAHIRACERER